MHRYKSFNTAMPTTAAATKVTTGAAGMKTMLQVATPANRQLTVISWGYELDAVPSTVSQVELLQTDVAATVTAHVASGVVRLEPNQPDSLVTLGVAATGFTASAEGAITATRLFDVNFAGPTAGEQSMSYDYQFMPDERPILAVSRFLRIRVSATAAVNMLCWVCWDE